MRFTADARAHNIRTITRHNLITALNLERYVQLAGWRSQREVIKLMESSDIFLAPSVTALNGDQEGTPTVLIEALASGLPVVSTVHSGIPDVVKDGDSGFLVPERNWSALAERVQYLIQHPEVWDKMSRAGRAWVEEHHNIDQLNNRLVKLFENLLKGIG